MSLLLPVQGALSTLLGAHGPGDRLWMVRYLLSRRIGWLPAPSERTLHLRGLPAPFAFDPELGGVSTYYEIARAKIYNRFSGFTPEPTSCVVDVGANLGMFSVWASRYLEPTGRIIALEPHPVAYRLLRTNLSRVRCGPSRATWPAALSSRHYHCTLARTDLQWPPWSRLPVRRSIGSM